MLSVYEPDVRRYAAVTAAFASFPQDMYDLITDETTAFMVPLMKQALSRRARGTRQRRVAATMRSDPYFGVPGIALGGPNAVFRDGTTGRQVARATEYGSDGHRKFTYLWHSPRPHRTPYDLTRATSASWTPDTGESGAFVGPAALEVAPLVIEFWADKVEDALIAAMSGGS